MANSGELFISSVDGVHRIKVSGRATFDCAPPLRDLAKSLENASFTAIRVDLGGCEWMDSTFMGVLAMLGLRAKAVKAAMEIWNAGEQNQALLISLGLKKLVTFTQGNLDDDADWTAGKTENLGMADGAQTVLEAHQTLMDVDGQNVEKFEKVVELVQKDIDRMNGQG